MKLFAQSGAKKTFSDIGLGLILFLLISNIAVVAALFILCFAVPEYVDSEIPPILNIIINIVCMYGVALPLVCLFWKKIPIAAPPKDKLSLKDVFVYFTIAYMLSYAGNILSNAVQMVIYNMTGAVMSSGNIEMVLMMKWYEAIIPVAVIAPFFEELLFRKIIIDRTRVYGEQLSAIFSALMFAFFHSSIHQFFYAFAVGYLFAYIYLRTGKVVYCWIIHGLFNIFGSILPIAIFEHLDLNEITRILQIEDSEQAAKELAEYALPMGLLAVMSLIMFAFLILGFIFFRKELKKIRFRKTQNELPKDTEGTTAFMNIGVMAYILLTVLLIFVPFTAKEQANDISYSQSEGVAENRSENDIPIDIPNI